jgi:hypothetical protein
VIYCEDGIGQKGERKKERKTKKEKTKNCRQKETLNE